jgi:hypothetical protein
MRKKLDKKEQQDRILRLAKSLLEYVESGDVTGCAIALVHKSGSISNEYECEDVISMAAAVSLLQHDAIYDISSRKESVDKPPQNYVVVETP